MNRVSPNLVTGIIMLLLIALLAGLGIEIKYKLPVLVPGSDKLGFLRSELGFLNE